MTFKILWPKRHISQVHLKDNLELKCFLTCTLIQAKKAFSYMRPKYKFRILTRSDSYLRFLMRFPRILDFKAVDSKMKRVKETAQDLLL